MQPDNKLQLSLAGMFLITAVAAIALAILRNAGAYWLILLLMIFIFVRMPGFDGLNPLLQAMGYALAVLILTSFLSVVFVVEPNVALGPCAVLPCLAYLLGFSKGMENA